jgi:hypothetical protein
MYHTVFACIATWQTRPADAVQESGLCFIPRISAAFAASLVAPKARIWCVEGGLLVYLCKKALFAMPEVCYILV